MVGVQHLEPVKVNQRIDHKCDVVIQNIRKDEAKITLWLDVAHSFTSLSFDSLLEARIIFFTCLKVKLFEASSSTAPVQHFSLLIQKFQN